MLKWRDGWVEVMMWWKYQFSKQTTIISACAAIIIAENVLVVNEL